jgi:hypothetical protein
MQSTCQPVTFDAIRFRLLKSTEKGPYIMITTSNAIVGWWKEESTGDEE